MAKEPPPSSLASLPGSNEGRKTSGVSTFDLMPAANKMPGSSPAKVDHAATPAPELLGSGGKIPENYDSRMLSQFSIPDPAIYSRKKQQDGSPDAQASWWSSEARPGMLGLTPYKTGNPVAPDSKDKSPKADKARAEKMAMEKAAKAKEQKALIGQKNFLLSRYCSGPQLGGDDAYRVMGQVSEINKQLGLPSRDFGNWFIKT